MFLGIHKLYRCAMDRWDTFWFSPTPSANYTLFRVCQGVTLMLYLAAWWRHAPEWIGTDGFHFPDEVFPPLPSGILPIFGIIQFGALLLFTLGWQTRLFAIVSWLCFCYVTLVDRIAAFSINSIFIFTLAIFAVYPGSGRIGGQLAATPVRLLQIALVAIYFSSGWHKAVYGNWLDSPTTLQNIMSGMFMTDIAARSLQTFPAGVWTAAQYVTLAFELFSPVLFFSRKLKWIGIAFGCVFHIGIALFMHQLIYFSLQMMSFYVLFLPADRQRKHFP